jgi:hypothetical protein
MLEKVKVEFLVWSCCEHDLDNHGLVLESKPFLSSGVMGKNYGFVHSWI